MQPSCSCRYQTFVNIKLTNVKTTGYQFKWNNKITPPPISMLKVMMHFGFCAGSYWFGGRGGLISHFILFEIVATALLKTLANVTIFHYEKQYIRKGFLSVICANLSKKVTNLMVIESTHNSQSNFLTLFGKQGISLISNSKLAIDKNRRQSMKTDRVKSHDVSLHRLVNHLDICRTPNVEIYDYCLNQSCFYH